MKKKKIALIFLVWALACTTVFFTTVKSVYPYLITKYTNTSNKNLLFDSYSAFTETVVFMTMAFFFVVISRRLVFSFFFAFSTYVSFVVLCLIKVSYLYSPIFPNDFLQVKELYQSKFFFMSILPFVITYGLSFVLVNYCLLKKEASLLKMKKKSAIISFTITFLIVLVAYYTYRDTIKSNLRKHGVFYKKNSNMVVHYLTKGIGTSFLQIAFFQDEYNPSKKYSKESIKYILDKYKLDKKEASKERKEISVIVLMVESMTLPSFFGWKTTAPAMPALSALAKEGRQGTLFSPVFGGKSINAEFELLTGFSLRHTVPESLVFREAIKHSVPSLAQSFGQRGYKTIAMRDEHVDRFGFKVIYDRLGFDDTFSFANKPLKKDPTGRHTDSEVIAKKIISETESEGPTFVFTFTMSSHAPWYGKDYNTDIDFIYEEKGFIDKEERLRMKGYLNSMKHMDDGIMFLLNHFRSSEKKVLLLILGDHQPHLEHYNKAGEESDDLSAMYRLPYFVWSNDDAIMEQRPPVISMNFLSDYLFELLDMPVCGLAKLNRKLHRKFSSFGSIDIMRKGVTEEEAKEIVDDFSLLQYDLLYGDKYSSELLPNGCRGE